MNGDDLERRIGRLRADARGLSRLRLLWRGRPAATAATAADCAQNARDPLRRLEPLRRRTEGMNAQSTAGVQTVDPVQV